MNELMCNLRRLIFSAVVSFLRRRFVVDTERVLDKDVDAVEIVNC